MKRFLLVMLMCLVGLASAWAAPRQASLVLVKATHPPVHRHHAHKAGKHHHPKRHRHKT
ncbi:MAG TPA: hypothetical protein VMD99_00880 [Terriglobales bacterium]|nr:hypothetical protein [Terriglobales bacterium]